MACEVGVCTKQYLQPWLHHVQRRVLVGVPAKEGLPPLAPAYGDDFFTDLGRYLPHAKYLAFLGGEPFLQKECYRIWDMLIDMDLEIPCHVTTNGSIYNDRIERLLQRLPFQFQHLG